jgi:hypothetical protein
MLAATARGRDVFDQRSLTVTNWVEHEQLATGSDTRFARWRDVYDLRRIGTLSVSRAELVAGPDIDRAINALTYLHNLQAPRVA